MQSLLFQTPQIVPKTSKFQYQASWLAPMEADQLLSELQRHITWEQHRIHMFGRELLAPRFSCWIGDADASYRYSGQNYQPQVWPEVLLPIRYRLQNELGQSFNSVLANRYRGGRDGMGWHSDDEPELGLQPVIASLSLGVARRFVIRQRAAPKIKIEYMLEHGSLLIMRNESQDLYQHALPKMLRITEERINLTFRWIHPSRHAAH